MALIRSQGAALFASSRRPSFDRVARLYRLCEHLLLGRSLTRTRNEHLPLLAGRRQGLVLGDGDGRFLAELLRTSPQLSATAIDSSSAMLRLLTHRCRFAGARLVTHHADVRDFLSSQTPKPHFDLVVTHFFLDCFSQAELSGLIPLVRGRLQPGALWVVSEFRVPPRGPARCAALLLIRGLYLAFRLLTGLQPKRLPDYASLLSHAGLTRMRSRHRLGGILTAELWRLHPEPGATE